MGNWRTVQLAGTMSAEDAAALREYLGYSYENIAPSAPQWKRFGPLSFDRDKPSLCGLNDWPAQKMNRSGNLAEHGYGPDDVAEQLRELVTVTPSLLLVVHCGGDYESLDCVATIRVGEGIVAIGEPEIATVEPMSDDEALGNLLRAISGGY